jgi:hypothetical protein
MSVASNCTESICIAYEYSLWLQRMVLGLMIVAYYCSNKVKRPYKCKLLLLS